MIKLIKKSDIISGLVILCFSGVGLYFAQRIPGSPSAFPIVTLGGMALLAFFLIGNSLRETNRGGKIRDKLESEPADGELETKPKSENTDGHEKSGTGQMLFLIGLLLITAIYIAALDVIGFVISTPIYIFVKLYVLGMRRYVLMIIISILTTASIFLVFRTVMYLSLPGGIFDPTEYIYQLFE